MSNDRLNLLFLEPFFGGSHKNFAEGLIAQSKHHITLLSMPARFWKWRMRGAALHIIRTMPPLRNFDGIIATNLMSLADFKALAGPDCPPILVYFHENQLTYPLAPGEKMDFQFGFTDITTALVADQILFNSKTHMDTFFSILPGFLRMMPELRPFWAIDAITGKSSFLHPGCQFPFKKKGPVFSPATPPLIIWNHRWEHDKNPGSFFNALEVLMHRGIDFRLAILGENFQTVPKEFLVAKERFGQRIVQYGYVRNRGEYIKWLEDGSIVISTANQENFGISIIEAIRYGCIPLLPNRLVYPEILPDRFHDFLYEDQENLVTKLYHVLSTYHEYEDKIESLSDFVGRYAWENTIDSYDEHFTRLVIGKPIERNFC